MDSVAIRWIVTARRSRRPQPRRYAHEYAAAEALILLANSDGGFCSKSTIFPPKKHQEVPDESVAVVVKKQEAGSPDTPLAATDYYCWFCDKVFESAQALGDHMSTHRVNKERLHKCSYCNQTFPSGQALGGHKRKHYDGPTLPRKAVKCSVASHAGLAIDINLPAPQE